MKKLLPLTFSTLIVLLVFILVRSSPNSYLSKTNNIRDDLGQSFVIGVYGTELNDEIKEHISTIHPGGIILYRRNFISYEQTMELIKSIQDFAISEIGTPLFIMSDEEPEGASRFEYEDSKLLKDIYVDGILDNDLLNHDVQKLSEMGINVALAPVLDYPFNKESFTRHRLPPIDTELELNAFNNSFIEILKQNNIDSTLKHFPGLGVLEHDVHFTNPMISVDVDQDTWQRSLSIFKNGIDQGAQFIMTTHVQYLNIDPEFRTTISKVLVEDILRGELGFDGFVITDDISEMIFGEDGNNLASIAQRSINAGHNLVLFSHHTDKTVSIFAELLNKVQSDKSFANRIIDNASAIRSYKNRTLQLQN